MNIAYSKAATFLDNSRISKKRAISYLLGEPLSKIQKTYPPSLDGRGLGGG